MVEKALIVLQFMSKRPLPPAKFTASDEVPGPVCHITLLVGTMELTRRSVIGARNLSNLAEQLLVVSTA